MADTKPYSVLLLYPDYIASNYGEETFFTNVDATSPANAVEVAQAQAAQGSEPEDFLPLLVLSGRHDALNHEDTAHPAAKE